MNKTNLTHFFVFLLGAGGAIFFQTVPREGYSFLGTAGSPMARLLSRLLTDKGDDAFHGGATHDVRFQPQTAAGSFVAKVARQRGVAGAAERQPTSAEVKSAYSQNVGKWVTMARKLDPGNFDALLTHCHYIFEGGFEVEVGDEEEHHHSVGKASSAPSLISESEMRGRKKAVARAVREYFQQAPMTDKAAWYSAAAAAHMLHEVEPAHYGIAREKRLTKLKAVSKMFINGGDACTVVWGGKDDAAAARQFAVGLAYSLDEVLEKPELKNTLFKTQDIP